MSSIKSASSVVGKIVPQGSLNALIVDADHQHSALLESLLLDRGYQPTLCTSLAQARALLSATCDCFSMAFITRGLPDGEGTELLSHEALLGRSTEIALLHDNDSLAPPNLGLDANYFFCKPIDADFVGTLLDDIRAEKITPRPVKPTRLDFSLDRFELLRGSSLPMRQLYRTIRKLSATPATVLLVGETGTGKELVARTLHLRSGVRGEFVAVNCGAIPAELAESELFGHEKGSFSGAEKQHCGYFEQADGGTLFLDEIGEMPLHLQTKLLRILESRHYRRVGGEKEIPLNVRVVAATNREPEAAVHEGLLREDLYFRLAQFPIRLPPLRDRGTDIIGLAQSFLEDLNLVHKTHKYFSAAALEALQEYPWPGNVRELKNAVERAYILAEEYIDEDDLPKEQASVSQDNDDLRITADSSLKDTVRKQIFATLESVDGNKKLAAEILGISLKTLYNRLRGYDDL